MLQAEGADSIHDPIYFLGGHTVHPLVQIPKDSLYGIGVCILYSW